MAASPFLPWRLKVEIKRIYEIADHALAPPQFFLYLNQGGLDTNFDVLKMKAHACGDLLELFSKTVTCGDLSNRL